MFSTGFATAFARSSSVVAITAYHLGVVGTASAQDLSTTDELEEVVVTGIRASLERSMDIKRDAQGVVDAITAEDIGRMPDTNLAESLQRITGISIDRVDGEGSRVTARGFGADYNMVTLNGRQMPAADAFGSAGGSGRAFSFENLAAESVSGVEVYKTGRADVASGGIGATINIKTARPLDNSGFRMSVGAKAVGDTTNRVGSDITPELSGLLSWTDPSDKFGIGLSSSYQKRNSGSTYAYVNDWQIRSWVPLGDPGALSIAGPASAITNQPAVGQLYGVPTSTGVNYTDRERERLNGQLTLQFRPMDNLTLTGDYTYAENKVIEQRGGLSMFYWQTPDRIEFDSGQPVATTRVYSETQFGLTKDLSFGGGYSNQTNELKSVGFNAKWDANDHFSLMLDAHDSSMASDPTGPQRIGDITFAYGAPVASGQVVTFNTRGAPTMRYGVNDSSGNNNGVIDKSEIGTQVAQTNTHSQKTDITEIRLGGELEFDTARLNFGVETRALEMRELFADTYNAMGDWGIANPGDIPASLYDVIGATDLWDDVNQSITPDVTTRTDILGMTQWAAAQFGFNPGFGPNTDYAQNHRVKEDTQSIYLQLSANSDLGAVPVTIVAGVRYETTHVKSTSVLQVPSEITWLQDNDFRIVYSTGKTPIEVRSSDDHVLPNLDLSFHFRDDLIGRISASKTLARAQYNQLRATINPGVPSGPVLLGVVPTAGAGNPKLQPLESNNFDVSLEWYFAKSSYVSAGFFYKRVDNFIGTENVTEAQFGLRDASSGPRAQAAQAALIAAGIPVTQQSLFVMTAILDNPSAFPNGAADFPLDNAGQNAVQATYDISPNATDPLFNFLTAKPINNRSAAIHGFEVGGQYFFGDFGIGVQGNYTIVRGDISFNDTGSPSASQFALVGLSDSANAALIYENFGFSARVAYNWRDKFLSATNVGAYNNPQYTADYSQVDVNVAYDINDSISVAGEVINLTGSNQRNYGRSELQLWRYSDFGPRYMLGVRYKL